MVEKISAQQRTDADVEAADMYIYSRLTLASVIRLACLKSAATSNFKPT